MLFGGTLPPETIPYTTVFRQHIYQTVDGKVVWPSVNGPIPQRWPSLPAGVAGFYTLYPNPDELLAGSWTKGCRPTSPGRSRAACSPPTLRPTRTPPPAASSPRSG
jgi:hypothetical protein